MGHEKERQIQQWDQGWTFMDSTICYLCLSEPALREFVKERADRTECSFCMRRPRQNVAVDFNSVMQLIGEAVDQYFSVASDTLAYDDEDDSLIGSTYDTQDVLEDIGWPSDNKAVIQEIVESFGYQTWCDRHPYSLTGVDKYDSSWDHFCETVKHKARYFFGAVDEDKHSETIPISELLGTIGSLVEAEGMITTLDPTTAFYRVRHHPSKDLCLTWRELGSPPVKYAKASRMSAAGISVFYAGLDLATARAETTLRSERKWIFTAAKWTSTRPLRVVDLTRTPSIPSVYSMARFNRDDLVFLRHFVDSISQPVIPDDRVHTDYVPTQIITEYFQLNLKLEEHRIDGIIYPSSQCKGRSIVIFASHDDLNPQLYYWAREEPPLLTLDEASIHTVRKYRRLQRTEEKGLNERRRA